MKTDTQRDTLLGADRATLGDVRRDFTEAADLTTGPATPCGRGYPPDTPDCG